MSKRYDLTGHRSGQLLVIDRHGVIGRNLRWNCRCDCGRTALVTTAALRNGKTKSCGCLLRAHQMSGQRTHGFSGTREHAAWKRAKTRCYNRNCPKYPDYGGRGIVMSDEWRDDCAAFMRDMGKAPTGCSLDRIDNDGPYAKGNCRWASNSQQANNTRRNHVLTFRGETKTIAEWSVVVGIPQTTITLRLNRYGFSTERALTEPLRVGWGCKRGT